VLIAFFLSSSKVSAKDQPAAANSSFFTSTQAGRCGRLAASSRHMQQCTCAVCGRSCSTIESLT
jgi:hypothetical protein